jgi:hypothetical protein
MSADSAAKMSVCTSQILIFLRHILLYPSQMHISRCKRTLTAVCLYHKASFLLRTSIFSNAYVNFIAYIFQSPCCRHCKCNF